VKEDLVNLVKLRRTKPLILQFFRSIRDGKIDRATAYAKAIREFYTQTESEFANGYIAALQGMVDSIKSKSYCTSSTFLYMLPNDLNPTKLKEIRRELLSRAHSPVGDNYDRGFFEAWADYLNFLMTLKPTIEKEKSTAN